MKKVFICVLVGLVMIAGCSCMSDKKEEKSKDVLKYLNEKYNAKFEFVKNGESIMFSKDDNFVCCDIQGNEFIVREREGVITDNYYSTIFDKDADKEFSYMFDFDSKIFITTSSYFTGEKKRFNNAKEYFSKCGYIQVRVYTENQSINLESVSQRLVEELGDYHYKMMVKVFVVKEEALGRVDTFWDELENSYILKKGSFNVNDKCQIEDEQWEG